MHRIILAVLTILHLSTSTENVLKAQEVLSFRTTNQFKVDYFFPGISYEFATGKKTTVVLSKSMDIFSRSIKPPFIYRFYSFASKSTFEIRRYYTQNERMLTHEKYFNNSGEYIGLLAEYQHMFKTKKNDISCIGIVWGLQRSYANRLNFSINGGLGYSTYRTQKVLNIPMDLTAHLSIGYILSTPKRVQRCPPTQTTLQNDFPSGFAWRF